MKSKRFFFLLLLVGLSSCSSKNTVTSNTSATVDTRTNLNCNEILLNKGISRNSLYEYCKKQKIKESSAYFYIGGFFGNSYYVRMKNNKLTYSVVSKGVKKSTSLVLTTNDLLKLEKKFKSLNLKNWKKHYKNSNARDGTHWKFEYNSTGLAINSSGSNAYPDNFNQVTEYISKVLLRGKKFN